MMLLLNEVSNKDLTINIRRLLQGLSLVRTSEVRKRKYKNQTEDGTGLVFLCINVNLSTNA